MPARIDVTNAMVNSGQSPIRLTQDTDIYFGEDCNFPFPYGNVITNDALGLHVRIYGAGCALNNSVGGSGPDSATAAVGINLYQCSLEVYGLNVGTAAKFMVGAEVTAPTDSAGNPNYAALPGPHIFEHCNFNGFQVALRAHGDDMTLREITASAGGGSAALFKAIAYDLWGHRQIANDVTLGPMVKGAFDLEIMGYHIEDAGGSEYTNMTGSNAAIIPGSAAVWFNSTDKFRAVDFSFSGWDYVFAGDVIADGWARGHADNYTPANLNNAKLVLEMT